jgi:hypothetical protein
MNKSFKDRTQVGASSKFQRQKTILQLGRLTKDLSNSTLGKIKKQNNDNKGYFGEPFEGVLQSSES